METAAPRPFAGGASDYAAPGGAFDPDAAASQATGEETMWEPVSRAMAAFKRIAGSYALLAVLDMRRAAVQLAWLVGAGIVVTVLCVTAWLAAVVGLAVWLLGQGMSWPAVLFIAAAVNVVAAGLVLWRMRHVFEAAPFAATLRQLNVEPHDKGRPT
jgi:uncharacterized membrane protein YqjE